MFRIIFFYEFAELFINLAESFFHRSIFISIKAPIIYYFKFIIFIVNYTKTYYCCSWINSQHSH